jgi:trimeric autotransporter adhesin
MRQFYLLFLSISLAFFGFFIPKNDDKDSVSSRYEKKVLETKKPNPPKKYRPLVLKPEKIEGNTVENLTQTWIDETLLVPTLTAVKSANVSSVAPGGTINYTVVLSNTAGVGAGNDATAVSFTDVLSNDLTLVAGSVKATPIATNDAYTSLGNVGITVPAANGLLANDVSPDNTTITATAVTDAATTDGGKITIQTNGAIDYTPKTGTTSTSDSYTYTLNSSNGTSATGTVTFTLSGMFWFVDKAAASNGDGSLASPFQDWANFGTANTGGSGKPDNNHTVFIYSNTNPYAGAVTLRTGQKVLGQGATVTLVSFAGLSLPTYSKTLPTTSGTNPNLTSSGTTITLGTGNTLRGFNMGNSTTDISGSSFGTLTASEMALNGNGQALNLSTGALAVTFTSISSTDASAEGISLLSVSGNLTSTGGTTITNPTTFGIAVYTASSVNANFGNTAITGSGNAGLVTTAPTLNTATITFADLDIAPDAGIQAINYFARGSLTCTSGTITTSNLSGSDGGIDIVGNSSSQKVALAMVLDSYTMTGNTSTIYGMEIRNASGSFTINGSGTMAGSGGTISTCTQRGANIVDASNITLKNMNFTNSSTSTTACTTPTSDNSSCYAAIHAKTVSGLTLNNISITGTHRNMGVNLNDVTNFSLTSSTITAVGGATGVTGNDAGGIFALNLKGTCSITNSNINDSNGRNFYC